MSHRKLSAAVACLTAALASHAVAAEQSPLGVKPLARAHAHNDYLHARPLHDALEHGFCSIEADVWLRGGELYVGHSLAEIRSNRTLESLYLKPLADRCRRRDGWVYDAGRTVTLLVDFKSAGDKTYPVLKAQLAKYRELFDSPKTVAAPVELIVTGDRPIDLIREEGNRLVSIDGRLADLGRGMDELIPLISDNWNAHFRWRGEGRMPEHERAQLRQHASDTHANKQRLRYWGAADNEAVWRELTAAGVDLIGADDLDRLEAFLHNQ